LGSAKDWRDRTVFAPTPPEISVIEIDDGDHRVVIERDANAGT